MAQESKPTLKLPYQTMRYLLICFSILYFTLNASGEYISAFGNQILSKTTLIAFGKVRKIIQMGQGVVIHYFEIKSLQLGMAEIGKEILVFQRTLPHQVEDKEAFFFLEKLKAKNTYELIGSISADEDEYNLKVQAFKELINIETFPNENERIARYKSYVMEILNTSNQWEKWHKLRELEHMVFTRAEIITQQDIQSLSTLFLNSIDKEFKEILGEIIATAREKVGDQKVSQDDNSLKTINKIDIHKRNLEQRQTALEKLKDSQGEEKLNAILSLSSFHDPVVEDKMLKLLNDSDHNVRALAAYLIGTCGSHRVIPKLIDTLRADSHLRVRKNIIRALGLLGARGSENEIALYLNIHYTQWEAINALVRISSREADTIINNFLSVNNTKYFQDLVECARNSMSRIK